MIKVRSLETGKDFIPSPPDNEEMKESFGGKQQHSINRSRSERVYFKDILTKDGFLVPMPGEAKRLKFLDEAKIFDTEPEEAFDRITALASRYFKVLFCSQ